MDHYFGDQAEAHGLVLGLIGDDGDIQLTIGAGFNETD